MKSKVLLLFSITCLALATAEPPDLLGNPVPEIGAPPLTSQVVIYKDVNTLPTDAVRALEAFNAAEAKARAAYDRQLEAERTRLLKALESAKVAATKAGNLEGAMATKAVSERLAADDTDGLIQALVSGKWLYHATGADGAVKDHTIVFDKDGKIFLCPSCKEDSYKLENGKLIFYTAQKTVWVTFIKSDTGWEQEPNTTNGNGKTYKLTRVQP